MTAKSLLIIDDNIDLADGYAVILQDQGFDVDVAYCGNDGVESYQNNHQDLVLLDIKLPDINGIEVLRQLHLQNPKVKVLIMTGFAIEQVLEQVQAQGKVEVFRRPFTIDQVFNSFIDNEDESLLLIADDDPFFAGTLSSYCSEYGLKPLLASSYKEVQQKKPQDEPVELLLLDLHMPLMKVLEVYLNLKLQNKIVKTIIVTGNVINIDNVEDPLNAPSVTGCLFKPFTPENLAGAINQALNLN